MPRASDQSLLRFPLSRALGSPANVRVLRALSLHSGQLPAPRLVAETRLAHRSVYLALTELAELGIVEVHGSDRSRLFSLRHEHPLAGPLRALFEAEHHRFSAVRDQIAAVAHACGADVVAVWLYGSVARGEDGPTSDVDIAVVTMPDARARVADEFRERIHDVEQTLSFHASVLAIDTTDVPRLDRENDPWWQSVLKDARPVVGERPADLLRSLRLTPKTKRKAS